MKSLLLDTVSWDLCLNVRRSIAVADNPYSLAQAAASRARTFTGDVYYDQTDGINYFANILGQKPPLSLIKTAIIAQVEKVPDVVSAKVFITSFINRGIQGPGGSPGGQIQVTSSDGTVVGVGI